MQNLKLDDDLKAGQVLVKVLAAPITVTDLGKVCARHFRSCPQLMHCRSRASTQPRSYHMLLATRVLLSLKKLVPE